MKKIALSELCEIQIGRTPSRSVVDYWGRGHKWVSIADMKKEIITSTKEEITDEAIQAIRCRKIPKGTLLLSFKLSVGKLAFAGTDLYTNEAIAALVIKNNSIINSKYLYYAMKVMKFVGGNQAVMGITLNSKSLAELKIPLPSLGDQIRIAAVLTRAEKLIAKRKESIKSLDEFLKSTFLEMFGDPVSMRKQQKTKLNDFIIFLTSGSRGWAQYYTESGELFLRINNVRDGYLKLDDIIFVTPPDNAEAVRTKVKKDDLLLSITADLGRTAVVSKDIEGAFINQHLALIRLKQDEINPMFVAWYFAMPYGKSIVMKKNREAVKAGLNFDDIRSFEIVTPSITLQNKFAAIVEKAEAIKVKYNESLVEMEKLYGGLSQRAFRGEL